MFITIKSKHHLIYKTDAAETTRQRAYTLVAQAYTSIAADDFAAFVGYSVEEAVKGVVTQGWQADPATRMVMPKKPEKMFPCGMMSHDHETERRCQEDVGDGTEDFDEKKREKRGDQKGRKRRGLMQGARRSQSERSSVYSNHQDAENISEDRKAAGSKSQVTLFPQMSLPFHVRRLTWQHTAFTSQASTGTVCSAFILTMNGQYLGDATQCPIWAKRGRSEVSYIRGQCRGRGDGGGSGHQAIHHPTTSEPGGLCTINKEKEGEGPEREQEMEKREERRKIEVVTDDMSEIRSIYYLYANHQPLHTSVILKYKYSSISRTSRNVEHESPNQ
ncbi:hypothetical protein PAMA_003578 [Pampus argenteus]